MDEAVRDYVDANDPAHRPLFDRVHRLVLREHPDVVVALSYKMPAYKPGRRRLHVGVWRHGVSMYGWVRNTSPTAPNVTPGSRPEPARSGYGQPTQRRSPTPTSGS